jgi:hypothetical protein
VAWSTNATNVVAGDANAAEDVFLRNLAGATTTRVSKSAVGFNAGVDISRPLSSRVGVGGLIRYSRGNVEFDDATTSRATAKAGGLELTGGVRLRF